MKRFLGIIVSVLSILILSTVSVFAANELEDNDSASSATSISTNTVVYGSSFDDDDDDWYVFELPKDGYINLDFKHQTSTNYLYPTCWNVGLHSFDYSDDYMAGWSVGVTSNLTTEKIGLPAGVYYICIDPTDYATGDDYNFIIKYTQSNVWEKEKNDYGESSASKVLTNTTHFGSSFDKDDDDWYVFELPKDGYINIDFKHQTSTNYLYPTCWNVGLHSFIYADDYMAGWSVGVASNLTTEHIGLPAGVYYICIDPTDYAKGEEYNFTINYTQSNVWEKERNDYKYEPSVAYTNKTCYGSSFNEDDDDWYVFKLTKDGFINIDFFHQTSTNYLSPTCWNIGLYSSDYAGDCIATWTVGVTSNLTTEYIGLSAGTYYIYVDPTDYAKGEDYRFTVNIPQTSINLDESNITIVCGNQYNLIATVVASNESPVWKSSNTKIAAVNQYGTVTAKQAGTVTITATIEGKKSASCKVQVLYKDVTNSSKFWYEPTYYLTSKNVVKGYNKQTKFKPANECTRAQMLTFMWRLAGSPNPKSEKSKFSDVKKSDYFYKPVLWAVEKGITTGYKGGKFKPQNVCTRAQTVTFLWRMAGKPTPKSKSCKFSDVKKNAYYYQATIWASEKKVVAGYSNGTFKPQGKCLRRQMVTFLYKYSKYVKK